jgi:hypothetical protein
MHGATIAGVVVGMAGLLGADLASAQDAGRATVRVGLMLMPTPFGALENQLPGGDVRVGSEFAFGVMPSLDVAPCANRFVGLASNFTFHVRARGANVEPANEIDILLRLGASAAVAQRIHLYAYLAPGYSFMSGLPGSVSTRGPVIGLHAGGTFDATPGFFLNGELGYQQGFQQTTLQGLDVRYDAALIQVGLGAGARI